MELIIKHNITKNNLFKLSLYNDKFTRVTEVFGSKNMGKLHLALKNVNRGGKAFQQGFWVANPKTAQKLIKTGKKLELSGGAKKPEQSSTIAAIEPNLSGKTRIKFNKDGSIQKETIIKKTEPEIKPIEPKKEETPTPEVNKETNTDEPQTPYNAPHRISRPSADRARRRIKGETKDEQHKDHKMKFPEKYINDATEEEFVDMESHYDEDVQTEKKQYEYRRKKNPHGVKEVQYHKSVADGDGYGFPKQMEFPDMAYKFAGMSAHAREEMILRGIDVNAIPKVIDMQRSVIEVDSFDTKTPIKYLIQVPYNNGAGSDINFKIKDHPEFDKVESKLIIAFTPNHEAGDAYIRTVWLNDDKDNHENGKLDGKYIRVGKNGVPTVSPQKQKELTPEERAEIKKNRKVAKKAAEKAAKIAKAAKKAT